MRQPAGRGTETNETLPVGREPAGEERSPLRRRRLPALAGFLLMAFLLFARTWSNPTSATVGAGGDRDLFLWFLGWTPFAISDGRDLLFTTFQNYPAGGNLMWNTSLVLPGTLLAPVTAALGPVFTFNLLATLGVALSAWCAYLAVGRFVERDAAAWLGGLIYGFSPYMLGQSLGHPHLTLAFFPPLLLMVMHETFIRQRISPGKMGALLGVLAGAQLLTGEEILTTSVLASGIGLAWLVLAHRRAVAPRAGHALRALGVAVAVFLALGAWPLWTQFLGPQRVDRLIQPQNVYVSDLAGFVVPAQQQWIAPDSAIDVSGRFSGFPSERNAYLGIPLLAVIGFTAVRYRSRPVVGFGVLTGLSLAVLSLGPSLHVAGRDTGIPLPWRVVEMIPIRLLHHILPNRLIVYVFLMAGILVGVFADGWMTSGRRRTLAAGASAICLVLISLAPRWPFPSAPLSVPSFFASEFVRRIPAGSVSLATGADFRQPMLWQIESGFRFRILEGFIIAPEIPAASVRQRAESARDLLSVVRLVKAGRRPPALDDATRRRLRAGLRSLGIGTVILGPVPARARTVEFFTSLIGRPPETIGGVDVWFDVSS